MGISVTIEEGENFQTVEVPLQIIVDALSTEETLVEEKLAETIPLQCEVTIVNGNSFSLAWSMGFKTELFPGSISEHNDDILGL